MRNAASSGTIIAPGSYISITISAAARTTFLANATVSLTTADGVGARLNLVVAPQEENIATPFTYWAVVPASTKLGTALVSAVSGDVTIQGFVEISAAGPGLFEGALNHPATLNALTSAAVPGGIVSLFATGLNGASTAEVSVDLAGQTIAPLYAGPQGQAGLDQINFRVPANPQMGCYVPVTIRARGVVSNVEMLSINGDSFACAHPLGLSYSELRTLDAGGTVPLARLGVYRNDALVPGPTEFAQLNVTAANASFMAVFAGPQVSSEQYFGCSVSLGVGLGGARGGLGFGVAALIDGLALAGPGDRKLELTGEGSFLNASVPVDTIPFFVGGPWTLTGAGGRLGAYQVPFSLPPVLHVTNLAADMAIPSNRDYRFTWDATGFESGSVVTVSAFAAGVSATCRVAAWAGELVMPQSTLALFAGENGSVQLGRGAIPGRTDFVPAAVEGRSRDSRSDRVQFRASDQREGGVNMRRAFILIALCAPALWAPPHIPLLWARNAASGGTSVAPGSFVWVEVMDGGNFDLDGMYVNLATQGTDIQLVPFLPPSAVEGVRYPQQVWIQIPATAPLGAASLSVRHATYQYLYDMSIEITATAPGIFTNDYRGGGPARALNAPATPNALTSAAVPGGTVMLFATGLNGAGTADVVVELAGKTIAPLYAGPQGQPGVDQINFVIPKDPQMGCYVPVTIRARGVLSNRATLAINGDPFACAHPLGLSYSEMKTLDGGGSVPLARLWIRRVSDQEPPDGAVMDFPVANARTIALLAGEQMPDAQRFSCLANGVYADPSIAQALDAGPTLLLAGPSGHQLALRRWPENTAFFPTAQQPYYQGLDLTTQPPIFIGGTWQLSGGGGTDIASFSESLTLPPPLSSLSLPDGAVLPSDRDFTVTWDPAGFGPGELVSIDIAPNGSFSAQSCTVPAWNGRIVLPKARLATVSGKDVVVYVTVVQHPAARRNFTLPAKTGPALHGVVSYEFRQTVQARVE
ncbi:MAG: hypothetical protein WDO18_23055 [Acidobacteriota bacterium]